MRRLSLILSLLAAPQIAAAVDLKSETASAFERYTADLEARLAPRFHGEHFLWFDQDPKLRAQLRTGAVVVRPATGSGLVTIKSGLIQDWNGAVFIPNATLQTALAVVQDYAQHAEIYKPVIEEAKLRSRQNDEFQVYMRIIKAKLFLSAVFNTEQKISFYSLDPSHVYSRSYATRIAEVSDPGKREHELPIGQDRGLLWRLNSYWFFEEADGGVYIAAESVSLTRDIPFGMGKLMGPLIQNVPGESLEQSLTQTQKAIATRSLKPTMTSGK